MRRTLKLCTTRMTDATNMLNAWRGPRAFSACTKDSHLILPYRGRARLTHMAIIAATGAPAPSFSAEFSLFKAFRQRKNQKGR